MADITLKMRTRYKWWFKPLLKVMFYASALGYVPSIKTVEWMVKNGTNVEVV